MRDGGLRWFLPRTTSSEFPRSPRRRGVGVVLPFSFPSVSVFLRRSPLNGFANVGGGRGLPGPNALVVCVSPSAERSLVVSLPSLSSSFFPSFSLSCRRLRGVLDGGVAVRTPPFPQRIAFLPFSSVPSTENDSAFSDSYSSSFPSFFFCSALALLSLSLSFRGGCGRGDGGGRRGE